jgi:hypothetical protein
MGKGTRAFPANLWGRKDRKGRGIRPMAGIVALVKVLALLGAMLVVPVQQAVRNRIGNPKPPN